MKLMNSNNSFCVYLYYRTSHLYYLLIALVAFFFALCTVQGVWAHSELVKTDPEDGQVLSESPAQVKTWFSEELESDLSTLQVLDSLGIQVNQGDGGIDLNDVEHSLMVVSLPASLPADIYTVRWAAFSEEDGDSTTGEFSFIVRNTQTNDAASLAESSSPAWRNGVIAIVFLALLIVLPIIIRYTSLRKRNKRA